MQNTITAVMSALASGPWSGAAGWLQSWRSHGEAFRDGPGGDTACGEPEVAGVPRTTTTTFVALTPFAGHVRTLTWGSVAWDGRTPIAGGDSACEDEDEA